MGYGRFVDQNKKYLNLDQFVKGYKPKFVFKAYIKQLQENNDL